MPSIRYIPSAAEWKYVFWAMEALGQEPFFYSLSKSMLASCPGMNVNTPVTLSFNNLTPNQQNLVTCLLSYLDRESAAAHNIQSIGNAVRYVPSTTEWKYVFYALEILSQDDIFFLLFKNCLANNPTMNVNTLLSPFIFNGLTPNQQSIVFDLLSYLDREASSLNNIQKAA